MDQRSGEIEGLPPLALQTLRDLDLAEAPDETRRPHVASASGVVRRGDFVYVIGDELLSLGIFRVSSQEPGGLTKVLGGELPADDDERKGEKPDLEALTAVPPFEGHPYGALFGLGSGSGPGRDRGFICAFAADGALDGEPREIDLSPLFDLLRGEVEVLNLEGASVMGDRLWLLNRGNDPDGMNAVAELSLADVLNSFGGDLRIDPHELADIRRYELGELDGVELTFSDATPLGGDVLAFTASAEAQGDDGPDGEIRGSVVGTIDLDGHVQRLRTIDRQYKVEGIDARIDTGVMDFLFVCDQDDPDVASPLLSGMMPADAAFEARS